MKRRGWISGAVVLLLVSGLVQCEAAGPSLSSAGPVLEDMGRQIENQSLGPEERLEIIKVLGEWQTAQVTSPLVAVLNDPKPEIREAAARALGWKGNDGAVRALRERVEASTEVVAVKAAAVGSLGRIGDRSVRALVVTLTRDPNASIRQAAVWSLALGLLADPSDRTSYLIELVDDTAADARARAEAVRGLASVKEERVVACLSRILEHEPRQAIVLPAGMSTEQERLLLRYAEGRDVPAWAAGALGRLEARTALPLLLSAAEDPKDFFLRLMAVESLVAWKATEAFPVFIRRLEDPLPEIRSLALTGLERLGDPKAVEPVLAHLSEEKHPLVRARMVTTLAALGGPKVRPQLEALEQRETEPEVLAALEVVLSQPAR